MSVPMDDLNLADGELRELLVGTWVTIGLVADTLADAGELDREALFARLVTAEADARRAGRQRHVAFAAVRWIFEALGDARQASVDEAPVRARKRANGSRVHPVA